MRPPESPEIIFYGAQWCVDCRTSKKIFEAHNVIFTYKNIENDEEARKEFDDIVDNDLRSIPRILFYQSNDKGEIVLAATLIEPSPRELTQALKTYGYIPEKI